MVKKSLLILMVLLFAGFTSIKAQETFHYGFEGSLENWTTIDADSDGHGWDLASVLMAGYLLPYHDGEDCMTSASYDNVALYPDNYLISPQGEYASITFWASAQDDEYAAEHFGVAVSTASNTDPDDFTTIQEWTMTAKSTGKGGNYMGRTRNTKEATWYEYVVNLSAYAGQDIYVAIRHFDCSDMFFLNVDDVTLTVPDNNVVIDFETGDFSQYDFNNTSSYAWTVVEEDGNHYMKSGNAGVASSTSTISATHVFESDGYIAFDYNCMGEGSSTFWDHCDFAIDGTQIFTHGADHQGWDSFLQELAAGSHTFTWSYTKDSSVNPTGDYFAVDNIVFGEGSPCVAPNSVDASIVPGTAVVTWNGFSESFNLGYKLASSSTWTEVANIEANTYTLTGLDEGNYDVRVEASCAPGNYATGAFAMMGAPQSTGDWYANACYAVGGEAWDGQFIHFSMQNIADITQANASTLSYDIYAAEYANGYVWYITTSGTLFRAALDNDTHSIGTAVEIASGFVAETATEMSYNPVDEMMYVMATGDAGDFLYQFDPANPGDGVTQIGTNAEHLYAFAINADGVAYGIRNDGGLYTVNLTTAAQTFVGSTGVACAYVQTMAFDLETGELFWGQIYSGSSHGLYKVDPATATAIFLGDLGSAGVELTGMFCAYGSTAPTTIGDVQLINYTAPAYQAHPSFELSTILGAHYSVESVNWYSGDQVMTSSDIFEEGNEYYMSVVVAPADGYEFDENAIVLFNGSAAACASTEITADGNLIANTITYQVHNSVIYDFEDGTLQGWTTIDADGDGYVWEANTAFGGHDGSIGIAYSQSYDNNVGPLTPDNYLVSPNKASYGYIAFWACAQDSGYPSEHFGVSVSTTGNTSAADFTLVQEWTLSAKGVGAKSMGRGGETKAQGNWYKYEVDLSSFDGQEIWVAIRHFNCTDWFYIDIDDVELAMADGVSENIVDVMAIYPNPAQDKVFVTSDVTVNEYRVYNVTGAEIMNNVVNNTTFEVNVDNLPAGVYYIRIYSEGLIQTKKFVKE